MKAALPIRPAVLVHGLHVTKAHAMGRVSARRTRRAGRWVPCPCDLCLHVRKRMDMAS